MIKLSEFCTPEEAHRIKYIAKLFNAQWVRVSE